MKVSLKLVIFLTKSLNNLSSYGQNNFKTNNMNFFLSILSSMFMAIALLGKNANAIDCGSCVCDQGEQHDSLKDLKDRTFQEDVTETDKSIHQCICSLESNLSTCWPLSFYSCAQQTILEVIRTSQSTTQRLS